MALDVMESKNHPRRHGRRTANRFASKQFYDIMILPCELERTVTTGGGLMKGRSYYFSSPANLLASGLVWPAYLLPTFL